MVVGVVMAIVLAAGIIAFSCVMKRGMRATIFLRGLEIRYPLATRKWRYTHAHDSVLIFRIYVGISLIEAREV